MNISKSKPTPSTSSPSSSSPLLLHVEAPWFDLIKSGKKTIEGRLNSSKHSTVTAGDIIWFASDKEKPFPEMAFEVKRVAPYATFRELLQGEDLAKVLPQIETVEMGVTVYEKYYSFERQQEIGVLAIEIGPIEDVKVSFSSVLFYLYISLTFPSYRYINVR